MPHLRSFPRRAVSAALLLIAVGLGPGHGAETLTGPEWAAWLRQAQGRIDALHLPALRRAIEDMTVTFGPRYPDGPQYLEALDRDHAAALQWMRRLDAGEGQDGAPLVQALDSLAQLRRRALMANPLLTDHPIVYVVRRQYAPDHHNTATMFQTGEINTASFAGGGALKAIDFSTDPPQVKTLLETEEGIIRDPDVHFDGERILFAWRKHIDVDSHLFELDTRTGQVRPLTGAPGVTDIDPFYLPDDRIAFSSTREPKYCMCNRHIMANLFRMDADGANIHQIGRSTLFEGHGSLLPDGRILYDRWEYIDRNFGDAQGLWTVNPDGVNHALYWGNNTNSPGGVIDARAIPGTEQVLCIFGSCHDRPWGALAIIDRRLGLEGRAPVIRTWPESAIDLVGVGDFDTFLRVSPRYEDPWPLSDKYFLCSRQTGRGEEMGIYLLDIFGNEMLLHVEAPGCFDPMPLAPRPRPPVIPERRDYENAEGTFYVTDVYRGTHMRGVRRGDVKYLRVIESPEKRFWTPGEWGGQGVHCPAMNWHDFNNKRILGTVPVEADGSAHFTLPSDTWVYFQLLDEDGMMIQSMRSGTIVQSGERTGCIGCHESRHETLLAHQQQTATAFLRPPDTLTGWHGEPRLFSYMTEVQPALDRACVQCHDYGQEGGEKLNLAPDRTETFNTSYTELWRKGYIRAIGAGPHEIQPAYSWGARVSPVITHLRQGHAADTLDAEAMERLVTWIDLNGPYYPEYACAYPDHLTGRSPLNPAQIARLSELTGVPLARLAGFHSSQGPQISFDRPPLSPCLANIADRDSDAWREALAIIEAGRDMLAQRPRADMEGFVMNPVDQARQDKYLHRQEIEMRNRAAIREGRKEYDPDMPTLPAP